MWDSCVHDWVDCMYVCIFSISHLAMFASSLYMRYHWLSCIDTLVSFFPRLNNSYFLWYPSMFLTDCCNQRGNVLANTSTSHFTSYLQASGEDGLWNAKHINRSSQKGCQVTRTSLLHLRLLLNSIRIDELSFESTKRFSQWYMIL